MKLKTAFTMTILLIGITLATLGFAQDSPQWQLPDGVKMRLGKGRPYDFAYSPDGTKLAIASGIGIWIYDAHTGEELNLFTGGNTPIRIVTFSPDGKTLLSDIDDNIICLWDVNSGRQLRRYDGLNHYYATEIAFNPDGKSFAAGDSSGDVHVWDIETGKELYRISGHWVTNIAYSPDGKILTADGLGGNWIRLYDSYTGSHLRHLIGHTEGVSSVAFSPDGKTLASGSSDDTVRLWDVETAVTWDGETDIQRDMFRSHTDGICYIAYSPDGRYLATASKDKTVQLRHASNLNRWYTFRSDTHYSLKIAFSPDSQTLVSRNSDGTIRMWYDNGGVNGRIGWGERIITGHIDTSIYNIDISADGNTLVTDGVDNALSLWDVNTGTHLRNLIGHKTYVRSVAFSPIDNTLIASGSHDGTLRLWNADTGTELRTLINISGYVSNILFSQDGKKVVCKTTTGNFDYSNHFRNSTFSVFDVETGLELQTIAAYKAPPPPIIRNYPGVHPTEHTEPVNGIALSPDGKVLASSSNDRTIRFWDVETGKHLRVFTDQAGWTSSMTFSPAGNILACISNAEIIHLWDVNSGTLLHTLTEHTDDVTCITFSLDGSTLTSSSGDDTIRFWDVSTGTLLNTFTGHKGHVNEVAFLPDGSTIATGGQDGTVLLWDTTVRLPSDTAVSFSPNSLVSPFIGEQLTLSLNITAGQNVAGYQATVNYDSTALRYVESAKGDYLPSSAYVIDPIIDGNTVTIGATTFADERYDDGTLATVTFEVIALKTSTVSLTDVLLTDLYGNSTTPQITATTEITAPAFLPEDVNRDGVVNISDLTYVASNIGKTGRHAADVNGDGVVNIVDLTLVAAKIGSADAAAPEVWSRDREVAPTRDQVEQWLQEARGLNLSDPAFQRGLLVLESLLKALTPKQTALLPNYPNPFNPETWIPYQLSTPADVSVVIYTSDGKLIRQLDIGYQPVGIYHHRSRAAYWDGRNSFGEPVASGIYFYTLTADKYAATRKMLIRK